ncbi:uncharacterized protein [Clytia hemisphaerica]|uniref:Uncharacterized protein n=1 Tax=Clytia hemisphaerica TaxID=252671 RepID=A0A7M5WYP5_9CNID
MPSSTARCMSKMDTDELFEFLSRKYGLSLSNKVKDLGLDGELFDVLLGCAQRVFYFEKMEITIKQMLILERDFNAPCNNQLMTGGQMTPSGRALASQRHKLRLRTIRKSTDAVWPPKAVDLPTFESDKLSNIMKLEDIVTDLKSKSLFGQMDLDDIRTMVKNRMTQRRRESRKRSIDFTKESLSTSKIHKITTPKKPKTPIRKGSPKNGPISPIRTKSPKTRPTSAKNLEKRKHLRSTPQITEDSQEDTEETPFHFGSPIKKAACATQEESSQFESQTQSLESQTQSLNNSGANIQHSHSPRSPRPIKKLSDLTSNDLREVTRLFTDKTELNKRAIFNEVSSFKQLKIKTQNVMTVEAMAEDVGRQLIKHKMVLVYSVPVKDLDDVFIIAK